MVKKVKPTAITVNTSLAGSTFISLLSKSKAATAKRASAGTEKARPSKIEKKRKPVTSKT